MSTDKPRASRRQLLADLMQAGREQSNAIVMYHSAVATRLGLSTTDEKILDLLEREGPLTAGQLVERTRLAPSSITAAIDRLQRGGFARRRPYAKDRRRVTVELCHEGLRGAPDLFADLTRRLKKLYASYNDDELAAVLRFMREATIAQRAATEELTKPSA
ncbi:MarR family winged helix-turn-helix transcriptional regulator [Actinopolymorpha rutila]|uniref:DNA-binding MarR family transcriptional regulator n=1 Tax=Actinopolymorpha rutila TaxID=446787 RepID=A0A852Z2I8_9ACTN|nr:MarR family transcriptional regulator [Actinopolymorpha rutila]NYH87637.1 DNA-binding MarR family transcriptional regulator [Actinopolymorpha rutila]